MNKKMIASIGAGLVFSCAALYLAFRNIPVKDLLHYFGSVNYLWLVPAGAIAVLSFILRVFRWQLILKTTRHVPFINVYHPLMIGFMLNCILPGRLGEIARPVILLKKENIPFSTGLGSIVTERLFDMICLIALLALVLSIVPIDPSLSVSVGDYKISGATLESVSSGMTRLCLVVILGVVLVSVRKSREAIAALFLKIPGALFFLSASYKKKCEKNIIRPLIQLMDHFAQGLSLFQRPGKTIACLLLSLTIWLVQALSYHVMTFSCPGIHISFFQTMTVMIMICFFIALPSVPGYWGLWEAGGLFALSLFSVAGDQAAGYTLINHVVQILPVMVAGMISAFILGINIKHLYKSIPQRHLT